MKQQSIMEKLTDLVKTVNEVKEDDSAWDFNEEIGDSKVGVWTKELAYHVCEDLNKIQAVVKYAHELMCDPILGYGMTKLEHDLTEALEKITKK